MFLAQRHQTREDRIVIYFRNQLQFKQSKSIKRTAIKALYDYMLWQRRKFTLANKAVEFCQKWLKHRSVQALKVFKNMKVKKLDNMRVVDEFLEEKRR